MSDEDRVRRMCEYRERLDAGIGSLQALEAVKIASAALAEIALETADDPKRTAADALLTMEAALGADGRDRAIEKVASDA